jgi:hypothetical protein|tara:strand:- start:438 stop:578 length:141 start_codon:yes stop_codon:yes gene_type:complete
MGKSKRNCIDHNCYTGIDNSILMLFWFFVAVAVAVLFGIVVAGMGK